MEVAFIQLFSLDKLENFYLISVYKLYLSVNVKIPSLE